MTMLQDGILAFLAAVGLTTVIWLLCGILLRVGRPSIPGVMLVLPLRGEAPAMEEDVRELRRVQHSLCGGEIVLVDCGLCEEARNMAQYLADREEGAVLVNRQEFHLE